MKLMMMKSNRTWIEKKKISHRQLGPLQGSSSFFGTLSR